MAKILVADDNSNVQKTVALALANLGVDVVSVNNGEAAVRKLSDFMPDLVLADIFMPVRNGYEVCEYVKKDSRFSHMPVVLLIGAFDPLDEREAQRVGADGILKKPFVPPDPLITMVKMLLDRTLGARLVTVPAAKPAVVGTASAEGSSVAEVHTPAPETSVESSNQEFPPPVDHVTFGEGDYPVAFGTLLETPPRDVAAPNQTAIEPVDDEQILTSSRDATLGDPIFWKNDSHEEGDSPPRSDEAMLLQPIEPLELVRDEPDEASPSVVDSDSVLLDQAAQALTVESDRADDLAANPIEWMASAPTEHSDAKPEATPGWDEPIPDAPDTIDRLESPDQLKVPAPVAALVSEPVLTPVLAQPTGPIAGELPISEPRTPVASEPPAYASPKTRIALSPAAQSAADTARSIPRKSWADLTANLQSSASELVSQQIKSESVHAVQVPPVPAGNSQPAIAGSVQEHSPDPALVEAVVQRVLDKMRPQVVDIITKEFLRPIVQALVHREIEKHS